MSKIFRTPEELGRDPDFIRSWTTNPAIVSVLLEAEQRLLDRQQAAQSA